MSYPQPFPLLTCQPSLCGFHLGFTIDHNIYVLVQEMYELGISPTLPVEPVAPTAPISYLRIVPASR